MESGERESGKVLPLQQLLDVTEYPMKNYADGGVIHVLDKTSLMYTIFSFNSGAPAREARSGAPWVTKLGKLSIRENLVMT